MAQFKPASSSVEHPIYKNGASIDEGFSEPQTAAKKLAAGAATSEGTLG
jgi:hypothetical protein